MPKRAQYVGKVTPQLILGLGGAGGAMVRHLYDLFHANRWWREVRKHSTQFLIFDTDARDIDKAASRPEIDTTLLQANPEAEVEDAFVRSIRGDFHARSSQAGAGQIRLEARLKLYGSEGAVRRALQGALGAALAEGNDFVNIAHKGVDVLVFGSLGGGTASGSLLPLAYLIRDEVEQRGWRPTLIANIVHGGGVVDRVGDLAEYVLANSFAALKEWEYLSSAGYRDEKIPFAWRRSKGPGDRVPLVDRAPYDLIYLADRPELDLDPGDVLDIALADAAYVHLVTPAGNVAASARDNYTRFQRELVEQVHKASAESFAAKGSSARYTLHWGSHGAAALTFPARDFVRFCAERWAADAFERYLGGGDRPQTERDPRHFSAEELRLLATREWAEGVEKQAERDWQAIRHAREAAGLAVTDGARPGLPGMVERVAALRCGDDAAPVVAESFDPFAAGADASAGASASVAVSVGQRVLDELVLGRAQRLTQAMPPPSTIAAHEIGAAWTKLQEMDRAFDDIQRGNDGRRVQAKAWATEGRWLDDLRGLLGGTEPLDGRATRYLLARLRVGCPRWQAGGTPWRDLDLEIREREARVEALYAGTFATNAQEMAAALQRRFDEVRDAATVEAQTGWFSRRVRGLLGKQGFDADTAIGDLSALLRRWQTDTDEFERLQTEVAILQGMRDCIDRRLQHLQVLAAQAERRAVALREQAQRRMEGVVRLTPRFTIDAEPLQPLGASAAQRQWGWLYEDLVVERLDGELSAEQVGAVVDEAVAAGEAPDQGFVASQVIEAIERDLIRAAEAGVERLVHRPDKPLRLGTLARSEAAGEATPTGGMGLDELLRIEALYQQIPAQVRARGRGWRADDGAAARAVAAQQADRRTRRQALAELERAWANASDPGHAGVRATVAGYVEGRLKAIAGRAVTLAKVADDPGGKRPPSLNQTTVVADSAVEQGLRALLPAHASTWKAIIPSTRQDANIQANAGDGLWTWEDPHTLFFYRVRGVVSIDRLVGINEAYDAYARFGTSTGKPKPHPFHIDTRWEGALSEIAPRAYEEANTLRTERLALLARALAAGVVARASARAHWKLTHGKFACTLGASDASLPDVFCREIAGWTETRRGEVSAAISAARLGRDRCDAALTRLQEALTAADHELPELARVVEQLRALRPAR